MTKQSKNDIQATHEDKPQEADNVKHNQSRASVEPLKDTKLCIKGVCFHVIIWCVALFLVAMLLVVTAIYGGRLQFQSFSIEFPIPGTTLVKTNGKPDKASLMVSASDIWVDTGLTLPANGKIEIIATGKATLAIHHIVGAARKDEMPTHRWVGPEGDVIESGKNSFDRSLFILPNVNEGALLAWLGRDGDPVPSKINPRPTQNGGIQYIGGRGSLTNPHEYPLRLWLTINDAVLDGTESSKRAYVRGNQSDALQLRWDYIISHQYWNVWFDDNVGFYQIQVQYPL